MRPQWGRRERVTADEFSLLYVTTDDVEEATVLARAVVAEGLAACANVLPDVMPVFRIDDEVAEAPGAAFLVMTRAALVARAMHFLEEHHRAECPCILALGVTGGNAAFLDWMRWETAETAPRRAPGRGGA
jgi:periplasmic divalent cation tolerance protein